MWEVGPEHMADTALTLYLLFPGCHGNAQGSAESVTLILLMETLSPREMQLLLQGPGLRASICSCAPNHPAPNSNIRQQSLIFVGKCWG